MTNLALENFETVFKTCNYETEFCLFLSQYIQFVLILYTVRGVKATNYSFCQ